MPATKHQEDVLKTDDKATQSRNLDASGQGGGDMQAIKHQQEVLKKPDASKENGSTAKP